MAIAFALLSLVFAAVNDVVFKLYARNIRSRGLYAAIVGIVWTVVFAGAALTSSERGEIFAGVTVYWGIVSGTFSITANILLLESMARLEAGVCATVYRLNLAFAAILAFIFLGETVTNGKLLGLGFAILAIACFAWHCRSAEDREKKGAVLSYGFLGLIILASLLRAGMGVSYKYALSSGAEQHGMLAFNGVMWIVLGGAYFLFRERSIPRSDNRKSWLYGMASGVLVCGIVFFMALALTHGEASVVLPVSQMSFIGTALLGRMLLGERIPLIKWLGILFGFGCVLAMSLH